MYPAVEKMVKPFVDRSMNIVTNTLSGTREAVVSSAHFLERGETPLHILTSAGLKLNKITHKSIASLVNVQSHMLEGTLHATAKRLEKAANANSFRQLVNDQVALMPNTRKRLAGEARKTLNVFVNTRDELKEMVAGTVAEFSKSRKNVTGTAKRVTKKTTRTARSTTKKASAKVRKTTANAKKTAKKTVRKATAKARK